MSVLRGFLCVCLKNQEEFFFFLIYTKSHPTHTHTSPNLQLNIDVCALNECFSLLGYKPAFVIVFTWKECEMLTYCSVCVVCVGEEQELSLFTHVTCI